MPLGGPANSGSPVATSSPSLRSSFMNLSIQWKENTREAWGSCSCQTEGMMGKSEWSQPAGSAVKITSVEFWCGEAAKTWLLWCCSSSFVFEQNLRQTQTGGNSRHVNSWHWIMVMQERWYLKQRTHKMMLSWVWHSAEAGTEEQQFCVTPNHTAPSLKWGTNQYLSISLRPPLSWTLWFPPSALEYIAHLLMCPLWFYRSAKHAFAIFLCSIISSCPLSIIAMLSSAISILNCPLSLYICCFHL